MTKKELIEALEPYDDNCLVMSLWEGFFLDKVTETSTLRVKQNGEEEVVKNIQLEFK